ncbi:MAG: 2-octaprenyl-6-methoxyphenyl hydroxylase [Steroidobacteraceae bacterium]
MDVVIAGGGMIGASLAVALAPLGLRVALIEPASLGSESQPSFDERTTALSNGSRRIYESIGIWPSVASEATPIRRIHVSDRGRFGFARIDAAEQGVAALGYVLANRALGAALWQRFAGDANLTVLCPATAAGLTSTPDGLAVSVEQGGQASRIDCQLLVAADGAQSSIRQALGIEATTWRYDQVGVITNVLAQKFHEHVAYERFTPTGPIAMLPMSEGRCSVVWTLSPDRAGEVTALSDEDFLRELQTAFGMRLGRLTRVGRRHAYPLALTCADEQTAERVVIIGNAAQGLHPIAGQGFNLGLRDVATLAELVAEHRTDLGSAVMLERYRDWRQTDRRSVVAFTDGLVRLFGNPLASVSAARNLGLLAFDLLPPAKAALSRLSMGVSGRLPKLARGLPLT